MDFLAWTAVGSRPEPTLLPTPGLHTAKTFGAWQVQLNERANLQDPLCCWAPVVPDPIPTSPESITEGTWARFHPDGGAWFTRALGGGPTIYYLHNSELTVVTTRLESLLALMPGLAIDHLAAAAFVDGWQSFPHNRSLLRGVSALPPGGTLRLRQRTLSTGWWWRPPEPRPTRVEAPALPPQARALRSHLQASVTASVKQLGPPIVLFSGGVDSSVLAALLPSEQQVALSLLPPRHLSCLSREQAYVLHPAIARNFTNHQTWTVAEADALDAISQRPSLFCHGRFRISALQQLADSTGRHHLMRGDFADEGFGSPLRLPDWAEQTSLWELLRSKSRWPLGLRTPLSWSRYHLRCRLGLAPWLARSVGEGFRPEVDSALRIWQRELLSSPTGRVLRVRDGVLASSDELNALAGLKDSFPFMSRACTELACSLPPEQLLGKETKVLLRRAFVDRMSDAHRLRPDKGAWRSFGRNALHPCPPISSEFECLFDSNWLERHRGKRVSFPIALRLRLFRHMLKSVEHFRNPKRQEPWTP